VPDRKNGESASGGQVEKIEKAFRDHKMDLEKILREKGREKKRSSRWLPTGDWTSRSFHS